MYDETLNLAEVPAAPVARPRVLIVATAFAAVAALMYFAGLIGIYLTQRAAEIAQGRVWLPESVDIPLTQANMLFGTLLLSVILIHWASQAARNDDRPHLYLALGLTLLMGFAFINQSFYLLSLTEMDLAAGRFELLVYTIAISHMIMLMAAMLYLVVVAFRALGGQETSVHHDGVKSAALLWDAMVLVYGLIWISIYVMK
ncbi:MAG: cytochrome c oxidase subunit 3 [Acidimicrobiales bacterium]|nr:cytochrome c oxidase subunit 3 [Acidimicrobiales bacterium]MCB1259803.1 cytochrome c oxidase subunit 3 [Acidimicrobiales bacterium]